MTKKSTSKENELTLTGLDGSNPLAFLAALGALRTHSIARPGCGVKMRWAKHSCAWRPVIAVSPGLSLNQTDFIKMLNESLISCPDDHPLTQMYSEEISEAPYTQTSYWTSAMRSDLAPDATNQLQTVRRDYFLGNLRSIIQETTETHLERTLFRQWDYGDKLDNQSLHLDPKEDRRYAYQWNEPSGDPNRKKSGGMLGANRLAIEAFPLFQSFAIGDKLMTCGFRGSRINNTFWTWPLWNGFLLCEVIMSLLRLKELQQSMPDPRKLAALGLIAVYRCQRILNEKTPNFAPTEALFSVNK